MLAVAWQTVRGHWVSFAGMFVALSLGIGCMVATALTMAATFSPPPRTPERFANAPVVVYPADTLQLQTDQGVQSVKRDQPASLSTKTIQSVESLGRTVADRTILAQIIDTSKKQTGHAWSSAAFGQYRLSVGQGPQNNAEIVVSNDVAKKVGDKAVVLTPTGVRMYTVSGLVRTVDFESPIFFADAEAARLSPAVNALVSFANSGAVRGAVGNDARVLTGDDRYLADPDPNRNKKIVNDMQILLGITGGFTVFVTLFIVASTFAFMAVQRLREFALLRAVGALPGQVRRMVLSEVLLLGIAASLCGSLLGIPGMQLFVNWLQHLGLAPTWFQVVILWQPIVFAGIAGVGVALLGAWTASLRASKTPPISALQEAEVDSRPMTKGRWIWLYISLVVTFIALFWIVSTRPRLAIIPQIYLGVLMLPVVAGALLAPAIIPRLITAVTLPLRPLRNPIGMIARESAITAVRRTASTAAPILLIVGLFVSLLGGAGAIREVPSAELVQTTKAPYVVIPTAAPVLFDQVVRQIQTTPGVTAVAAAPVRLYALDDETLRSYDAEAIEPERIATVLDVPLEAGSLNELRDTTIIVSENWGKEVGEKVDVWLTDGSRHNFTVGAVMETRVNPLDAYISSTHASGALAERVYVDADPAAFASLQVAMNRLGAQALPVKDWAAHRSDTVQTSQVGMLVALGVIGLYCAIALVNTLVMASAGRVRDIAALRLASATPGQIYWSIAVESLLVVVVGVILAAGVIIFNAAGHYFALSKLTAEPPIVIPWMAAGLTILACTGLALLASVIPVVRMARNGFSQIK